MSINKLYKSRKVILEMLEMRGYDISPYSNFSANEIETMFKSFEKKTTPELSSLDMSLVNKNGGKLYVKYLLASKLRGIYFKKLINEMFEQFLEEGDELIFILKDKVNNIQSFDGMLESYITVKNTFIQIFCLDNLQFNITKHRLVPYMRVMTEEEKKEIMDRYSATKVQMPQIKKSDAHAKFVGVRKGDLCEIIRASETAGSCTTYRYCLN